MIGWQAGGSKRGSLLERLIDALPLTVLTAGTFLAVKLLEWLGRRPGAAPSGSSAPIKRMKVGVSGRMIAVDTVPFLTGLKRLREENGRTVAPPWLLKPILDKAVINVLLELEGGAGLSLAVSGDIGLVAEISDTDAASRLLAGLAGVLGGEL